ncbi:hypothetical protein LRQ20_20870 [Pseudomonas sp. MAFF 311096]|uniref:Uncharacterized protein n=3 Tax=Pseudomonas petroselini TaxID=2899822 RepID=A0ABS8QZ45_9PSED|nr:hypothetical protein [Pseudomonas petroselini]MCD7040755.1 hypothetical protein [Pseudomonas petroselini]
MTRSSRKFATVWELLLRYPLTAINNRPRHDAAGRWVLCLSNSVKQVGGGLLPIAVEQSPMHQLTHRHREQAPSHSLIAMLQVDIRWLLILDAPSNTLAERRLESVGNPAS